MTSKAMTTKREDDFHASAGYHPLTTASILELRAGPKTTGDDE
jgi:hypothetical protein